MYCQVNSTKVSNAGSSSNSKQMGETKQCNSSLGCGLKSFIKFQSIRPSLESLHPPSLSSTDSRLVLWPRRSILRGKQKTTLPLFHTVVGWVIEVCVLLYQNFCHYSKTVIFFFELLNSALGKVKCCFSTSTSSFLLWPYFFFLLFFLDLNVFTRSFLFLCLFPVIRVQSPNIGTQVIPES